MSLTFQPTARPMRRRQVFLLLLLVALAFLPGLGARDVWNPDEPRYAEVAREMSISGDLSGWAVPRLQDVIYNHKPPLHFWNIAIVGTLRGGVDEVAARLPSVIAAAISLLAVFWLGLQLFGEGAAWGAALAFLGSNKILWQGRIGQIDMTLTACILIAMSCWVASHFLGRNRAIWGFWIATGVGTVAKGPVALLPPLLSILVYLAIQRDREGLRRLRPALGLLTYLAVVALWFVPAIAIGGREYFEVLVMDQTVKRYAASIYHPRPWWYFLQSLPTDFMPFTVILPAALIALRTHLRRASLLFPLCWVATTIFFFSLSAGKRGVYVVALIAPLALIVGAGIDALRQADTPRGARPALIVGFALAALVLIAVPVALPQVAAGTEELEVFGAAVLRRAVVLATLLAVAAVAALVLVARRRLLAAVATLSLGMCATVSLTSALLLPEIDVFKSPRPLAEYMADSIPENEPYGVWPEPDAAFAFYSGRYLYNILGHTRRGPEDPTDLRPVRRYLSRDERVWLFIEEELLEGADPPLDIWFDPESRSWHEGHVLVSNRPPAGTAASP